MRIRDKEIMRRRDGEIERELMDTGLHTEKFLERGFLAKLIAVTGRCVVPVVSPSRRSKVLSITSMASVAAVSFFESVKIVMIG